MKILFILHVPPPIHGSSIVGNLIKESRIINESFDCQYINFGTSFEVEEIGRNFIGKLSRYISLIWQVKKQLLTFKPDLCYFSPNSKGIGFYKDAFIVLLVRMFGVKPVYHFHNKGVSKRQDKFFDNLLYRLVFRNADVILISKHLYPDMSKYVPESRVHYCPNGLPDIKDKRQKSQDKSISSGLRAQVSGGKITDYQLPITNYHSHLTPHPSLLTPHASRLTPQILFISHLIESKGVYILLDACKVLHGKGIDFHCTMIGGEGDISEQQLTLQVEKAGLSNKILVAGKRYGEDKEKAFEQADIFVHPSFEDCLPLVLLEAMQRSLPIVSTFEGAIPDVVEDGKTGFLVPQKDASALAEKLEFLIEDPELASQMGAAGRRKYEQEFTLAKFEGRMVGILEEVVSHE